MSKTILVTGAASGYQGSTGNRILHLLVKRGFKVRALVHKIDERSQRLEKLGAEVLQGDLLDLDSVRKTLRGVKRAYFTYPVDDGLLEATATFAAAARDAQTEMVVICLNFRTSLLLQASATCNTGLPTRSLT